ncbi:MAG: hypothetical protein Q4D66_02990 [Bacteroidales bacterium]|nr:hypothetical protein [Bacteroidales bacterium]
MKSFRHSFRLLLSQRGALSRQLWRPYTAFAIAAALFIVGGVHLLTRWFLPLGWLQSEGVPNEVVAQIVGVDLAGIACTIVGLLACIVCAVWAHRASRKAAAPYARAKNEKMHSERRIMRITLCASLIAFWGLLWTLPMLTISLGIGTLTMAQLQDDLVVLPMALWWTLAAIAAIGMWVLQVLAFYIRLVLTHRAF